MRDTITPGDWFLGQEETDPGEHAWDGKVWAAPLPEEIEAAKGTDLENALEPWEVATFSSEADARLFLASREMLGVCEGLAELTDGTFDERDILENLKRWGAEAREAIAKAKGA